MRKKKSLAIWAAAASAGAAAGAVAFGRFGMPAELPLPPAIDGERRTVEGRAGGLSYYVLGTGRPVLLVHSINAAASAYEMRPLAEALARDRRVFVVDLPGFGFSERSDRSYDIRLYADALRDMVDEIAADSGSQPVDAIALSLSSEFLARVAAESPELFRRLVLITPTGFEHGADARRGPEGSSREIAGLRATLSAPPWRRGLYNLLVSRPSIRFFLEKTWGSKRIDEGAFRYAYLTSHQPGAEFAPLAFLSGRLFSADIRTVYEALAMPVLVLHGTRGDFSDFATIGWTRERANWRVVPLDTGALAHFEELGAVVSLCREVLDGPEPAAGQGSSPGPRSPSP